MFLNILKIILLFLHRKKKLIEFISSTDAVLKSLMWCVVYVYRVEKRKNCESRTSINSLNYVHYEIFCYAKKRCENTKNNIYNQKKVSKYF